jgi:hypothetical protein
MIMFTMLWVGGALIGIISSQLKKSPGFTAAVSLLWMLTMFIVIYAVRYEK